jgi:pilus assembly protein Flp/PilA
MRSWWACGSQAMTDVIFRLIEDSCGVTAIEYALIAALIAVAAIAAFTLVGTNLSTTFSYIASQL